MPAGLRTVLRSGIRAGALCVLAAWSTISQAAVPSGFFVETVARPDGAGWDQVVGVAFSKSGRLFAWEKTGSVWIVNPQQPLASRFLDLRDEVHAPHDHGLLGFALHPNFDSTGYVYALFTVERHHLINCDSPRTGAPVCGPGYVAGTHLEANATIGRIVRYRAVIPAGESDYRNARTVDPASRVVLLGESHWYSDPNQLDPLTKPRDTGCAQLHLSHGVGTLAFGEDGTLLASCGDGAHWTTTDVGSHPESFYAQALVDGIITAKQNVGTLRSQLLDSSSGKILRLDPISGDGIPSNPFYDAARPRAARSRVYALGFRNPYRFTVIPETGDHDPAGGNPGRLHVGDVGQYYWEELNVIRPGGANAGWPLFEGNNSYVSAGATTVNVLDAVNPLFNGTSCTRQYFRFTELLKQDTLGTPSWPNPCDASQQIVSTPVFLHDRPELSWGRTADARFPAFDGTTAVSAAIGTIAPDGMTVTGTAFSGNASVGGIWYGGASFPATYRDTYFHADYGAGWIRNMRFDANGTLLEVRTFADDLAGVVGLAEHPLTGDLYFAQYYNIKRIRYAPTSNIAPVAVAAADPLYGPSALSVQFSGAESSDPNGDSLTYSWDFGDGSPVASGATVSHTYTGAGIRNFDATLIVRDTGGLEGSSTLLVSLNNSPPQVAITSPVDGSQYSLAGTTTVPLAAAISDDESTIGELSCEWVKILHHSAHSHESSPITSCSGSMPIEPVGCVDDRYFYEVRLTVTDPHGLSTERSAFLYPDCGPSVDTLPPSAPGGLTATAISSARIDLSWGAATDAVGVVGYEVERCKGVLCTSFMPLGTSSGTTFSDLGLAASTLYRYRVRARDAAGNTGRYSPIAGATTAAGPPFALRLNAAGPAYTDAAGNGWSADSGFNTGSATTYAASTAIAGTSDPTLYRSERWDGAAAPELTYSFTVPNGSYQVRLHFAETYAGTFGVGLRVFDVQAEGVLAIDNLDVFAAVGANTALVRTINVTVTDGQLNLTFLHGVENPMVNAIEILEAP